MRTVLLRRNPRLAATAVAAAGVLALLVIAGVSLLPGSGAATNGGGASGAPSASPQVNARMAGRISITGSASFSWSPDGALLLVSDSDSSRVYDRAATLVGTFPAPEGWLDAGHLIGGDGVVSDAHTSRPATSGVPPNTRVIANGHGAAAIVTGTAGCSADPLVQWYRNGTLEQTQERANPLGWSPDGSNVLLGHVSCDPTATASSTAAGDAWRGDVQLVDFASGAVEGTLPHVQGSIAFGVGGDSVAAQAGDSTVILDAGGPDAQTLPAARFLGWLDTETIFVERDTRILVADLDPPNVSDATAYPRWQAAGPNGINLAANLDGSALAILRDDGSTLLDLSGRDLVAVRPPAAAEPIVTGMQPEWWAPDGGTIALESVDGTSLTLISIDRGA